MVELYLTATVSQVVFGANWSSLLFEQEMTRIIPVNSKTKKNKLFFFIDTYL